MRPVLTALLCAHVVGVAGCPAPGAPGGEDSGLDAAVVDVGASDARPDAPDAPDAPDVSDPCADPDVDGDGADSMACGGIDCDDTDPLRAPGLPEFCEVADRDEDCDTRTFGFRDADGDAHGDSVCCNEAMDGTRRCGTDCDDARPDVHPGLPEACDGSDNDCDGAVDEAVLRTFYGDLDGDDFGDPASTPRTACTPMANEAENATDCDDTEPGVNPGASEACDGLDNDCDGSVDERLTTSTCYRDADLDGYTGTETMEQCGGCRGPEWLGAPTLRVDCDDANASAFPGQTAYFITPRAGGSYDYDCNGLQDFDPSPGVCASRTVSSACNGSVAFSSAPPACGASVNTVTCWWTAGGCMNLSATGSSTNARCR